jgi:hypothetical protein
MRRGLAHCATLLSQQREREKTDVSGGIGETAKRQLDDRSARGQSQSVALDKPVEVLWQVGNSRDWSGGCFCAALRFTAAVCRWFGPSES